MWIVNLGIIFNNIEREFMNYREVSDYYYKGNGIALAMEFI